VPASPHIALVTAAEAHGLDDDLEPLVGALHARGAQVSVLDWDDDTVDWSEPDLALIRSTWDYTDRRDEFLAWARRAADSTRLEHDARVLAWNTDKRYLDDLAALGMPVVPTAFLPPGSAFLPPGSALTPPGDGEFVVKPTVGAGSRETARYSSGRLDDAAAHVERLWASGQVAMVQPYLTAVDEVGEAALLFFGGRFSHAITKGALLRLDAAPSRALFAPELITARRPAADELELATEVLAGLPKVPAVGIELDPPLYARIDLLRTDAGGLEVLEVELCEPSVFLGTSPGAADRFAAAVLERARRDPARSDPARTDPKPRGNR